ncbi:HEAT repeat domain-containing protein [Haloferula sp. BvORR071]|uniref:HEAT repeat domain-containing protein n=1 Tax=Haloferula sp. BvORR071 TaxID=1396141 RepID=UPI0005568E30|nr:HEAT repeat domain-containing protein [Haloferula sp. BvORR071]
MNRRTLAAAGGVCLLLAAGGLFLNGKKTAEPSAQVQESKVHETPAKPEQRPDAPTSQSSAKSAPEKLSDEQRTAILGKIEEASVTYDPKGLPLIEPYLLHPDPEVRSAALNGMIVLGESGAAPMLREASKRAPTPKEAVALEETAAYLELPSGTFVTKDRTAPGSRVPNKGDAAERSRPKLGPKPKTEVSPPPGPQKTAPASPPDESQ